MDSQNGPSQNRLWEMVPGMLMGSRALPALADLPVFLQLLLANGDLSQDDLTALTRGNKLTPQALEPALLPVVGHQKLLQALATHYGVVGLDLENADISPQVALVVPQDVGTSFHVACVDLNESGMTLAMIDVHDDKAVGAVETKTDFRVTKRVVVLASDLKAFQDLLYGSPRTLQISPRDIVDDILRMAIEQDASDVHIEPLEDEIQVRFRKDGVLIKSFDMHAIAPKRLIIRHLKTALPVVIKNKSGASGKTMNIAESQKPQDGRIYLPGRGLDLRVSILPSVHGESIVIRIHRSRSEAVDFKQLGFSERTLKAFLHIIQSPYGILLVSGPTGSGKTTTLYNVLRHLNSPEKKILTIEDPVECVIPSVVQVQTNAAKGVTFAEALRSFLRHDPDIVMVGEIRDRETALMAVEASLTGHLVLSSIHANDAVRTVTRIKDLGVNPLLVSSTCLGTLAQRLVRTNCIHCRQKARFSERFHRLADRYGVFCSRENLLQGRGCPRCNHTGYLGRTGIYELMVMTAELRDAILRNAPDAELERLARRQGMRLLIEEALTKAAHGLTTEAEVLRVTLADMGDDEAPPLEPLVRSHAVPAYKRESSQMERQPSLSPTEVVAQESMPHGSSSQAPSPANLAEPAPAAADGPTPASVDEQAGSAARGDEQVVPSRRDPSPGARPREHSRTLARDSVPGAPRARRGL